MAVFESILDYMDHYKGYQNDIHRHSPIDALYIVDRAHLIISLNHPDFEQSRPDPNRQTVLIHKSLMQKYYPTLDAIMIKPNQSYYDPKDNRIKFIKNKNPFHRTWFFTIRTDRYFGRTKPTKLSRINYNWFFDEDKKRLNFVLNDQRYLAT